MKYLLLTGCIFLVVCKEPCLQSVSYKEAIENCRYQKEKIKEKYPNNELISVRPDCLYGAQLPLLEMADMDGNIISTKSLKGKKNIINFWFIACPPCMKEIPWLNRLKKELGEETINYIAIGRDSSRDTREFLLKKEFSFIIVPDGVHLIEEQFGHLWGYPFTIVTDENLTITHILNVKATEEDFRAEIKPFLVD